MQTSQAHQAVPRTRLHRGTPGARKTSGKTACVGARVNCGLYCERPEREAHLEEAEGAERDEDDGEAEEDGLEDPSCAVDAAGDVALEAAECSVDLAACSCEAEHVWEASRERRAPPRRRLLLLLLLALHPARSPGAQTPLSSPRELIAMRTSTQTPSATPRSPSSSLVVPARRDGAHLDLSSSSSPRPDFSFD